jgi:hypothetical protein
MNGFISLDRVDIDSSSGKSPVKTGLTESSAHIGCCIGRSRSVNWDVDAGKQKAPRGRAAGAIASVKVSIVHFLF